MRQLLLFIFLIITMFLAGCANITKPANNEPADIVNAYFKAWSNKDYPTMYDRISDGFKFIEPTAKKIDDFKLYAELQGIEEVNIVSIKQTSNNGKTATVDYEIAFVISGKEIPFEGTFTLKYKPNDTVPGWKLIHPYGENIDTS